MATIKIIQRTKPLSSGLFPIYLRATKNRKSKFISLNLACEKSQWNDSKHEFRKNFPSYKQFNNSLTEIENRAKKIISDTIAKGNDITLIEFEELFFNFRVNDKITVNDFWDKHIEDLVISGRTGNARFYKDSKRNFMKFMGIDTVFYFKDITPILLSKYEVYLRSNGNMDSGIAVKMRAIRAIYNDAIKKGYAKEENYPFKLYKISKLKTNSNKRALSIDNIIKIRNFNTYESPNLIDAKQYFLFSYYTGGMNFHDMMMLTWENIKEDRIIYVRSKTKGRFTIKVLLPVKEILDYYKNQKRTTKYVFPILLRENLTAQQIENRKGKTLKKYNKDLKSLARACGIEEKITSYVARHSFATNLKQKGVSTDIISEAMGHQNIAITQVYLKDLENDIIDDAMENLL